MGHRKAQAGFSLVELIIVIAIMAILIAILAPQYLKYVEKTKTNKDADSFGKLVEIVEYTIIDKNQSLNDNSVDEVTVTWNTSGGQSATFTISGVDNSFSEEVNSSLNGTGTDNTMPCTSRTFRGSGSVSVTFRCSTSGDSWTRVSNGVFSSYVDY